MAVTREQSAAMEAASKEQLPEVRLLRPQPGDVIVVHVNERVSSQVGHRLAEQVQAAVGIPDISVLVLGPGMDLDVVRRDGA